MIHRGQRSEADKHDGYFRRAVAAASTDLARLDATPAAAALLTTPVALMSAEVRAPVIAARFLAQYAGHTLTAYRRDVTGYSSWLAGLGIDPLAATRATLDVYARQLAETPRPATGRPASPATVARTLACLSGFYAYADSEGAVARNPMTHVRRPKVGQDSQTLGLDRSEARLLLDRAGKDGPRSAALVVVLLTGGLRVGEALGSDVADLAVARGHRVLTVTRKGGARRQLVLAPAAADAVERYLAGRTTGPLFVTASGLRWTAGEAYLTVRRLARGAGVANAEKITPHSLRHTFVTLAREAGVPLEDVQDAVGHADPRTTRRYDRARHNLDRSPAYALGAFLAAA